MFLFDFKKQKFMHAHLMSFHNTKCNENTYILQALNDTSNNSISISFCTEIKAVSAMRKRVLVDRPGHFFLNILTVASPAECSAFTPIFPLPKIEKLNALSYHLSNKWCELTMKVTP